MVNFSSYAKAVLFALPSAILWFQIVALATEAYYGSNIQEYAEKEVRKIYDLQQLQVTGYGSIKNHVQHSKRAYFDQGVHSR